MKKGMKRLVAFLLVMTMLIGVETIAFAAKPTDSGKNKEEKPVAQKVSKVTCTASGKVNVSFRGKVTYSDTLSVVIADESGKEMECKILKKNKGLMSVSAKGLVKGQKYTITIEGVMAKNAAEPATITKTFVAKGMKTANKVSKATVKYNKFVILKLKTSASYKDATVTVKDADGKEYAAKIVKKAKGNIKIQVEGLEKGKKYTVTVTGIKTKKEKNYSSVTKTFTVK